MKAYQAYSSPIMDKFRFREQYYLNTYKDIKAPLVIFGCYSDDVYEVIKNHKSTVILVWLGKDTIEADFMRVKLPKVIHVTWIPAIQTHLKAQGIRCGLIKMVVKENPHPNPVKLGQSVYTYLQRTKPEYHGGEMVNSLDLKHPLLIGEHKINREAWLNGINESYYSRVFVGLALSSYAGGAMSILEMGVRGIRVVTNVLSLPNCISWKTKEDIEQAIQQESENIGIVNEVLVEEMYKYLVEVDCFDLDKLIIN